MASLESSKEIGGGMAEDFTRERSDFAFASSGSQYSPQVVADDRPARAKEIRQTRKIGSDPPERFHRKQADQTFDDEKGSVFDPPLNSFERFRLLLRHHGSVNMRYRRRMRGRQ